MTKALFSTGASRQNIFLDVPFWRLLTNLIVHMFGKVS